MTPSALRIVSPIPVYRDEILSNTLAPRPASLEGKVIALLPNWRPSAVEILKTLGRVLEERYRPKAVILEQPTREVPVRKGRLLDGMREALDDLARRADAVITATGD